MQLQVDSCLAMELPQCVKPSLGQLLVQLFLNTYGRLGALADHNTGTSTIGSTVRCCAA